MTAVAATPNAEELSESPAVQARDWFALGVRPQQVLARLQRLYGLEAAEAEACFEEMIEKLEADFASAADAAQDQAAEFYRTIKHNPQTPWGARLKAQIDLERLLQLVARAAEPAGRRDREVLEAFAFHEKLIAADGPTPNQKLRSHARRLLLLGMHPQPERRGPRTFHRANVVTNTPAPYACVDAAPPVRPGEVRAAREKTCRPHGRCAPGDAELQAFAREKLVREMTRNEAECQAVCRMLAESTPERAQSLLAALRARHLGGAPHVPASDRSPLPAAQPPPRT